MNPTEFENGKLNDSNGLLDNQSMVLEFALFDRKIVKIIASTSLGMKVVFGISLLILETLGNCLLFCMVLYEKFGMDSKKRTITNQLLSRMILALIFFNIFFMPIYFFGFLIPFSKYFQQFYEWSICSNITFNVTFWLDYYPFHVIGDFGFYRIFTHILLTLAEMVIFKILYMYKFSMIVALDEYFLTNFVTLMNGMMHFGLTIIRYSLGEHRRTRVYFRNFAGPTEFYTKIHWP